MKPRGPTRLSLPLLASVLYFSEGFPFGIVTETINLYLSFSGTSLAAIGLAGGVGLAWTLKVFWAPLVDLVGSYRQWVFGSLTALAAALLAIAWSDPASPLFWAALVALAVASATQDIAIDALTIRITPEKMLGVVNSARVTAYRVAIIAAGGGVAVLAAKTGWRPALAATAVVPLAVGAVLFFTLPGDSGRAERQQNPFRALGAWLTRPGSLVLLAVILLYRLGDSALTPMIKPFWRSAGFGAAEIGNVTTTLGMICTIAGAIAGGAFVTRFGVYRGLWVLGLAQMLSNLAYASIAAASAARPAYYGAAVVETFCNGLGTAAFLSFLMLICDKANAATEYAMLSAVFGLSRTLAGTISGFFAQDLGFATYFALTAALAVPGLLLLPLIRGRVAPAAR